MSFLTIQSFLSLSFSSTFFISISFSNKGSTTPLFVIEDRGTPCILGNPFFSFSSFLLLVHGEIVGAPGRSSRRQHVVGDHGELGEENEGGQEEAAQEHHVVLGHREGLGLEGGLCGEKRKKLRKEGKKRERR